MECISLFSGCLGLDLGLERAGFDLLACVEKESSCRETIRKNRPGVPIFEDITKLSVRELLKASGRRKGQVTLLCGGPPCQSFSTIGRRGSVLDERGQLLFEYLRILEGVRPKFFVMENVKGLLSSYGGKRPVLEDLLDRLADKGYTNTEFTVLNAADYGVPQKRERLLLIGSRLKGRIPLPEPTHGDSWVTLGDVIKDLEDDPGACARFSKKMLSFLRKIPQGGNWRSLSLKDRKKAMGNADLSSGGLTAFYRRLSYDLPSPTLLTSPTQRATTLCHPTQDRPLSVLEYKRIQGFPDDWALEGTLAQRYRQLGNAVPVGLGEAVGRRLAS